MRKGAIRGEFITNSEEETIKLGIELGLRLRPPRAILIFGDLGAGKTTLAKGIAVGLGVASPHEVCSPSFILINEHHGRCKIYHVDLYRIDKASDMESIGLDDVLADEAVVIIEWADKLAHTPPDSITVRIEDLGGERRKITIHESDRKRRGSRVAA